MMQVRSCRTFRYSKSLANLCMRESFYIMQYQHRSHPFRKLGQCFAQPSPQLVSLSGIPKTTCQRLVQLIGGPHLSPASQIQRGVRDDAVEPGSERLIQIETVQRLVRPHERFLNRILRVFVYRDDRPGDSVSALRMQMNEYSKRPLIASLGGRGQSPLIRRITRLVGHALSGRDGGRWHRVEI